MSESLSGLEHFDGLARLFPLPSLVFFPNVMQPLHIFEPRYRQMTADAIEGDRLIALALPRSGWEKTYAGAPAIHPVACLGSIVADQKLEDGRYNLLLRGVSRIRVLEEIDNGKLYRTARVELLHDTPCADDAEAAELRKRLIEFAPRLFPQTGQVKAEFRKLLMGPLPLGSLGDIAAFALPLPAEFKQELLEETDVRRRLTLFLTHLAAAAPHADVDRKFPPDFSTN
jgi:Lon protease-like protein